MYCKKGGVDIHVRMERFANIGYSILNKRWRDVSKPFEVNMYINNGKDSFQGFYPRFSPDFQDRIILFITQRIKNTPI